MGREDEYSKLKISEILFIDTDSTPQMCLILNPQETKRVTASSVLLRMTEDTFEILEIAAILM
jgi:hypothetical protein